MGSWPFEDRLSKGGIGLESSGFYLEAWKVAKNTPSGPFYIRML